MLHSGHFNIDYSIKSYKQIRYFLYVEKKTECKYVRTFWHNFFQKYEKVCKISFHQTLSGVILGVNYHVSRHPSRRVTLTITFNFNAPT